MIWRNLCVTIKINKIYINKTDMRHCHLKLSFFRSKATNCHCLIHISALKIVPLVVLSILHRFCKILWYCCILFLFWISPVYCESKKKIQYFYCFKSILQNFKLLLLTDLSELWFYSLLRKCMDLIKCYCKILLWCCCTVDYPLTSPLITLILHLQC